MQQFTNFHFLHMGCSASMSRYLAEYLTGDVLTSLRITERDYYLPLQESFGMEEDMRFHLKHPRILPQLSRTKQELLETASTLEDIQAQPSPLFPGVLDVSDSTLYKVSQWAFFPSLDHTT